MKDMNIQTKFKRYRYADNDLTKALKRANRAVKPIHHLSRNSYQEWAEKNDGPHGHTILNRYKTWANALEEADLPFERRRSVNRISEEECVEAILEVAKLTGRLPTVSAYTRYWKSGDPTIGVKCLKDEGFPSASLIRVRWGKWSDALKEAQRKLNE